MTTGQRDWSCISKPIILFVSINNKRNITVYLKFSLFLHIPTLYIEYLNIIILRYLVHPRFSANLSMDCF